MRLDLVITAVATVSLWRLWRSWPKRYPWRYGDIDGDGQVTNLDAQMVRDYDVGFIDLTPDQYQRADVNGDGQVDSTDVQLIAQYAAGLRTIFPVEVQI